MLSFSKIWLYPESDRQFLGHQGVVVGQGILSVLANNPAPKSLIQ